MEVHVSCDIYILGCKSVRTSTAWKLSCLHGSKDFVATNVCEGYLGLLHIMVCFAAAVGLIHLLGLIDHSAGNSDSCTVYAAVGGNVTLPLVFEGLGKSHLLKWTHNKTTIFYRQNGRVSHGKPEDVTTTGSILLKNVEFSKTGIYEANVSRSDGALVKMWTGHLCVMEKVSKPQLSYVCDSSAVNLRCHTDRPQGLSFSWTFNKKTLLSETRQTLSISLSQLDEERDFSCSVANKVSEESSAAVRPACEAPLLCFKPQTVVAALAGGAVLTVLLFVAVMILCCCLKCNKTKTNLRDKGQLKMLSMKKCEAESICPDYETTHHMQNSSSSSPKPSPRACCESLSRPDAQTENGPLQLPAAAEGQRSSPVPKPRTKVAQTQNI